MKILITADWHVKGERPICRLDDNWIESQRKTISEIRDVFEENMCDQMWILGDLFDAPRCSTEAVNMLVEELLKFPTGSVKVLCGNHDLKDHNFDNLKMCSIGTAKQIFGDIPSNIETYMKGRSYTVSAKPFGLDEENDCDIVCTHQLTFPDKATQGIFGGVTADELLARWPKAKFILTGDYHHGFIYKKIPDISLNDEEHARFVITPGCTNIQKADELDYQPMVVLLDLARLNIQPVYLDTQHENCTRDHIEAREHKEEQFEQVVETIKGSTDISLDFDSNLEMQVKKLDPAIIDEYEILRETINGEK